MGDDEPLDLGVEQSDLQSRQQHLPVFNLQILAVDLANLFETQLKVWLQVHTQRLLQNLFNTDLSRSVLALTWRTRGEPCDRAACA